MRCKDVDALANARLVSPSAERNRGPMAEVLKRLLPARGLVLEIASGTGQHVVHFARAMPALAWQPTERDAGSIRSIAAWLAVEALDNVRPPLLLDVRATPWPISSADALVCMNMIHIAPWPAAEALVRGAGATVVAGGLFCLYGPFRLQGRHTSPSNKAFDAQLRAQDPEWGVRDIDDVARLADAAGFDLAQTVEMPANNLAVVFRRRA